MGSPHLTKLMIIHITKQRVRLFFLLLSCLLFMPGAAEAVKVELDTESSTSSASMSVGVLVDGFLINSGEWSSSEIQYSGLVGAQKELGEITFPAYARASASIDCSVQGFSPEPGVRYIHSKEICKVQFNPNCVAQPGGYWDPDAKTYVLIPASFSCNLSAAGSVVWELLPSTDDEKIGDPVIVSFGPVRYSVGAYSEGTEFQQRLYIQTFGVLGREVLGPYESTSPTVPQDPFWPDLEIHAYIGDKIVLSYEIECDSQSSDETQWSSMALGWGTFSGLSLAVSAMPAIIAPNVVGKTHLEAEMALDAAGFVGTGALDIPTCDDEVPAGNVISQDPSAGTWVSYLLQGVILHISGALVPDVVGMTHVEAEASLSPAGLVKGTVVYDYSDTVPAGIVMGQTPDAMTYVDCDSAVNLLISQGSNGDGDGDGCAPPDAELLHPLSVGLRYVYSRLDGDAETSWTVERDFVEKMTANSMDYYLLGSWNYDNDGEYEPGWFVRSTKNAVYSYNPPDDNLEFRAAPVGTTWTFYDEHWSGLDYKTVEIIAIEEVEVPYGTFCAYKHRKYRHDDTAEVRSPYLYEWIVPGVGIVKEEDYWTRNGQTAPLIMELIDIEHGSVGDLVSISVGRASYDRRTGQFSVDVTVSNVSSTVIGSPVWLVIESISNPGVTLANPDGTTTDGKPYIDLSPLLGDGRLEPGQTTNKRIYFNNPKRLKFAFTPSVRGVIMEVPEVPE